MIIVLLHTLLYRQQAGPGTQIARDGEIMRLGRIKTFSDQTCLIWINFLVKDQVTYPKPWFSSWLLHCAVTLTLWPQGNTFSSWWHHTYVCTGASSFWSLATSPNGTDWFTSTSFWASSSIGGSYFSPGKVFYISNFARVFSVWRIWTDASTCVVIYKINGFIL